MLKPDMGYMDMQLLASGYLDAVEIVQEIGSADPELEEFAQGHRCRYCKVADGATLNMHSPSNHKYGCRWARSRMLVDKWDRMTNTKS